MSTRVTKDNADWSRVRYGTGSSTNPKSPYTNAQLKQLALTLGLSQSGDKTTLLKNLEQYRPEGAQNRQLYPMKSMYEKLPPDLILKLMQDLIEEGDHQTYLTLCQTSSYIHKMCKILEQEMPSFWYRLLEQTDDIGAMKNYLNNAVVWDKVMTDKGGKKNPNYGKIIDKDIKGNETENKNLVGKSIYQLWKMFVVDNKGLIYQGDNFEDIRDIVDEIINGNINSIKYIMEINEPNNMLVFMEATSVAAYNGENEIFKYLSDIIVNKFPQTVEMDEDLMTAAIVGGNIDIVKFLQDKGINIDDMGITSLSNASESGNPDMLEYIRQQLPQQFDQYKDQLLSEAYSVDITKYLIDNGADMRCRGSRGMNVLDNAVVHRDINLIDYIMNVTSDIYTNDEIKYAMDIAVDMGDSSIVKKLQTYGVNLSQNVDNNDSEINLWDMALINAAIRGDIESVKTARDNGADINAYGGEPLMDAAYHGNLEIVKYLVDNGADYYLGEDGQDPLTMAESGRQAFGGDVYKDIIEYLDSL